MKNFYSIRSISIISQNMVNYLKIILYPEEDMDNEFICSKHILVNNGILLFQFCETVKYPIVTRHIWS